MMTEKEEVQHKEYVTDKVSQADDDFTESSDKTEPAFVKSPEEAAFLRKLNWTVLPVVFLIIWIQVIKKVIPQAMSNTDKLCIVLRQIFIDCGCSAWYNGGYWHEWLSIQLGRLHLLSRLLGLSGIISSKCI